MKRTVIPALFSFLFLILAAQPAVLAAKSSHSPSTDASSSSRSRKHRRHKFLYMGHPVATPLGDADTIYVNCYYGDDGSGNPTGVSSIELDDSANGCGDGASDTCVGTMSQCDCAVGLYSTGCD